MIDKHGEEQIERSSEEALAYVESLIKEKLADIPIKVYRAVGENIIVEVPRKYLRNVAKVVHDDLDAYVLSLIHI